MKLLRSSIFGALFFYTLLCTLTIFFSGGLNNVEMTTDFHHYHRFWHEYTNFTLSDFSINTYQSSPEGDMDWMPNPIYSLIALFPIAIFGSPILLKLIGFICGSIYLLTIKDLCKYLKPNFSVWQINFLLIGICGNRWFIKESLGLSTMFLCSFFFIISLSVSNNLLRSLFLSLSMVIRPNFIIFFLPFLISIIGYNYIHKKSFNNLFKSCILPLLIFPFCYLFIHSEYPGGPWNMIFYAKGQGFDWAQPYIYDLIKTSTNIILPLDIFDWDVNLNTLFEIFKSNFGIVFYFFQIYLLKILSCLGMRFEQSLSLPENGGWYLAEAWSFLYFIFLSLPGFILSIILLFRKSNYVEYSIYIISLLYILGTSIFIGDPRYSLLVMPAILLSLIRGVTIIRSA